MNKSAFGLGISRILLHCAIAASLVGCATQGNATVVSTRDERVTIDPGELEAFVDSFFPEQMNELHTPGLALIVVQDGEVLLAKGYGSANLEQDIPFDPDETVVRIGSISKLFVATAVMQLVEQGKLDLHTDVNSYLDDSAFQVDDSYPEPVTLAHLLTHTSGYGESAESSTDPATILPLGEYLAEHMPPRLAPPGESWHYSGHGNAVAALVVEEVSGQPFDRYVSQNILQPLDMNQSHYLLSPPLPDRLAVGYVYRDGGHTPQPIEYYGDYPGASLVSTAADMARFMLAHLQEGCYQDTCILQPATITEMHQRQASAPYGGHAYGLVEGIKNGQRLIGHSGAVHGFGNNLDLLPEHDLGYFFSFNLECMDSPACDIIPTFRQQFMDRFFPSES